MAARLKLVTVLREGKWSTPFLGEDAAEAESAYDRETHDAANEEVLFFSHPQYARRADAATIADNILCAQRGAETTAAKAAAPVPSPGGEGQGEGAPAESPAAPAPAKAVKKFKK